MDFNEFMECITANLNSEKEINKLLVDRYPFLLPTNRWTGKVADDYDFSYTELDAMEDGWRAAFGLHMCEEIKEELDKIENEQSRSSYRIMQIKEKYGSLRWYTNWTTDGLEKVIAKYEAESCRTCCKCGAPATKISLGWISPWCDECAERVKQCDALMPIEEYFKEEEEEEEDAEVE
jgi:hypothetical protein